MKFNITIEETQTYEVKVDASDLSEAEEKALLNYGYRGEVLSTNTIVVGQKMDGKED